MSRESALIAAAREQAKVDYPQVMCSLGHWCVRWSKDSITAFPSESIARRCAASERLLQVCEASYSLLLLATHDYAKRGDTDAVERFDATAAAVSAAIASATKGDKP